jgi:hypothetical protein
MVWTGRSVDVLGRSHLDVLDLAKGVPYGFMPLTALRRAHRVRYLTGSGNSLGRPKPPSVWWAGTLLDPVNMTRGHS